MIHPIDNYAGIKLREIRIEKGFSQEKLAAVLKISFQQIQKYERGHNRISASKLWEIATLFNIPVTHFFPEHLPSQEEMSLEIMKMKALLVQRFLSLQNNQYQCALLEIAKTIQTLDHGGFYEKENL